MTYRCPILVGKGSINTQFTACASRVVSVASTRAESTVDSTLFTGREREGERGERERERGGGGRGQRERERKRERERERGGVVYYSAQT